jgi:DNA-directed RNA polymerase specialized sigma24 family protein
MKSHRIHIDLKTSWPEFLDLMDSDSVSARAELHIFAHRVLADCRGLLLPISSQQDRDDLISDLVNFHLCDDNFRVLRKYQNTGRPFAAWLYVVAHNFARARARSIRQGVREQNCTYEEIDRLADGSKSTLSHDQKRVAQRALELTKVCLTKASPKCKALLSLAADELAPQTIALLVYQDAGLNKKVSDDLRFCRSRLLDCLSGQGVDLDEVWSALGGQE